MPGRVTRALKNLLGPRLPLPSDIHVCACCARDFVNPVSWDAAGDERWVVALRCGGCGHERTREISRTEARRLDGSLDRGYDAIARAADRLERELMAAWVESFAGALERDLIDVADFARPE
jgi:hypothetical protein